MHRIKYFILSSIFFCAAITYSGEIRFSDSDGNAYSGNFTTHSAIGFTIQSQTGDFTTFQWKSLPSSIVYSILAENISVENLDSWFDIAYILETLKGGQLFADKALEAALEIDPSAKRTVESFLKNRSFLTTTPTPLTMVSNDLMEMFEDKPVFERVPKSVGQHILALCLDKKGNLWVGTEENGLWVEDLSAPEGERWRSFMPKPIVPNIPQTFPGRNSKLRPVADEPEIKRRLAEKPKYYDTPVVKLEPGDFPEDTVTSLVCDNLGRIWAGHLRYGVSVWNGNSWKTYHNGNGPFGHRVFDMKVSPIDGDVWIAMETGLTRYRIDTDKWTNYTMADGLVSHQIIAFCFNKDTGDIWVGYDTHGVGYAKRDENGEYSEWRNFRAPDRFIAVDSQRNKTWYIPNTPTGEGLPSNFVNDIVVDHSGTVWVGTHTGLAWSKDTGKTWRYIRGHDWDDRVRGLYQAPSPVWNCQPHDIWMPSDNVRRIVLDERGVLWLGFWRNEWIAFMPSIDIPLSLNNPNAINRIDFAYTLLPTATGLIVGSYGHGVSEIKLDGLAGMNVNKSVHKTSVSAMIPHPSTAAVATVEDLRMLLKTLQSIPASDETIKMFSLPDDWRTRGNWLGRYGKYWAVLAATNAPKNDVWGAGEKKVQYQHFIGPHKATGDSVRHWVHWLYTTDIRSLEMSPTFYDSRIKKGLGLPHETRRQAEWDDHAEAYRNSWHGPHLYCSLRIPEGEYIISLYNFNKDGKQAENRFRDYPIFIKELQSGKGMKDLEDWDKRTELERGRFHHFRGGVWKRWYVKGPIDLTIELRRDVAWNVILASIMLDALDPFPYPYFNKLEQTITDENTSEVGEFIRIAAAIMDETEALRKRNPKEWTAYRRPVLMSLWQSLKSIQAAESVITEQAGTQFNQLPKETSENRIYFLRAKAAYELGLFEEYEDAIRALGLTTAREIEKSLEWDQRSSTHYGRGREMVIQYINEKSSVAR